MEKRDKRIAHARVLVTDASYDHFEAVMPKIVKAQIFDHLHLSPIDIALKKLSLP